MIHAFWQSNKSLCSFYDNNVIRDSKVLAVNIYVTICRSSQINQFLTNTALFIKRLLSSEILL